MRGVRFITFLSLASIGCGDQPTATDGSDEATSDADGTAADGESTSDGDGTTTGDGDGTTTTGDGDGTTATGDGDGTTAGDGDGTTSAGDGTTGDGDGTTAGDGDGTTSAGDGTTGDGDGTTAGDGDGTTSAGDGTTGDGDGTTAGDGDGTSAGDGTTGDGDGTTTTGDGDGTAGCGTPHSAGASTHSLTVGGTSRDYIIAIPAGYDSSQPYPLVFAWHGRGLDGAIARSYYGVEEASNDQAIFVYPDGLPIASQGGQTGWDLSESGDDVAFFDAMLADLEATTCVDADRVFSTGHSFGGYMSNALACFRGDDLRGIGAVAGGPSFGFGGCNGSVGAWLAHDPADAVVAFSQGTMARDQYVSRNACGAGTTPASPNPCVSYDGCAAGIPVHWCEHSDGGATGHNWPGFAGDGIWAFFDAL